MLGKVLFDSTHLAELQAGYDLGSGIIYDSVAASIARADTAASYTAESVIDGGPTPTDCDSGWTTDNYYCTAGETTDQTRTDYLAAMNMMQAAIDSALAYLITDTTTYADKSVALLRHWCTTASTLMEPVVAYAAMSEGDKLRLALVLPGFCLAADLLYDYSGWSTYRSTFETWAGDLGDAMAANRSGAIDNKYTWTLSGEAACACVTGDMVALDSAISGFQANILNLIDADGSLKIDRDRDDTAFFYHTFHLGAMVLLAEMAYLNNRENLYAFQSNGRGIKLVTDLLYPFIVDADPVAAWNTFATANGYADQVGISDIAGNSGCFEFLNRRYGSDYDDVFTTLITRPASWIPNYYSARWPLDWTLVGYKDQSTPNPAYKDIKAVVFNDVCTTSIEQQTFDCGETWVPKVAIFKLSSATANGTNADDLIIGFGIAASTTARGCFSMVCEDGQTNSDTARGGETDNCIAISAANPATSPDGLADLVSFGAGTVTVEWINAPSAAFKIEVTLLGGDDLSVFYENTDPNDSLDGSVTVTPGFETEAVIVLNPDDVMDGQYDNVYGRFSFGAAVADENSSTGFRQMSAMFESEDGRPDSQVNHAFATNYVGGKSGSSTSERFEIGGKTSTTFTITTREAAISANEKLMVLALNFGGAKASLMPVITPDATGNELFNTDFAPCLVMGCLTNYVYSDSHRNDVDSNFNLFAFDANSNVGSFSFTDNDGADPSDTKSRFNTTIETLNVSGTVENAITPSMADAGFNLNYTTANGYLLGWALSLPAETIPIAAITANITEDGDTVSASLTSPRNVTSTVNESGDTVAASIVSLRNIIASITEAGDTAAASIVSLRNITATIEELGDTTGASLVGIVPLNITANINEAGDVISASIVSPRNIATSISEDGDLIAAALDVLVKINANITEAGDVTAASMVEVLVITLPEEIILIPAEGRIIIIQEEGRIILPQEDGRIIKLD